MAKEGAVEVGVERERADAPRPDEAVTVEQHAPPACDPLERLGREVAAQQRRHVHPFDPPQPTLRLVALAPRLPDGLDAHLRGARRRRSGTRTSSSRRPPRATREAPGPRVAAGTSAARARRTSRRPSPPAALPAAPGPRTTAGRRSARHVRRRGHATEGRSRRALARFASVRPSDSAKERAKLGSEPPIAPWPGWV